MTRATEACPQKSRPVQSTGRLEGERNWKNSIRLAQRWAPPPDAPPPPPELPLPPPALPLLPLLLPDPPPDRKPELLPPEFKPEFEPPEGRLRFEPFCVPVPGVVPVALVPVPLPAAVPELPVSPLLMPEAGGWLPVPALRGFSVVLTALGLVVFCDGVVTLPAEGVPLLLI